MTCRPAGMHDLGSWLRLETVMCMRPLYLMSWVCRRDIEGHHDGGAEVDWKWFDPEYIRAAAAATRAAFEK